MNKNNLKPQLTKKLTLYVMLCILVASGLVILVAYIVSALGVNLYIVNALVYLLIGLSLSLTISVIITSIVGKQITKYYDNIRIALNKVANSDFNVNLEQTKWNYINEVIDDFNKMVQELNNVSMLHSDFISNFSHEFKTPIASVKGFAELLRDKPNISAEEKQEYLDIIIQECNRMSELSNNTLLLSKLETLTELNNCKKVYIDEQIDQTLFLMEKDIKDKGIKVTTKMSPAAVYSDPTTLRQVWINIIGNAIKFTKDKIDIKVVSNKKNVTITIQDNGIGIHSDALPYIFDKFYQADTSHQGEGNGLGLSITKRIIELNQGTISVESKLNEYTKFTITLNTTKTVNKAKK